MKSQEELGEEICEYCPIEPSDRGVHCYGGSVSMCEGSKCDDAYENYIESQEDKNET
jgi:hypothetical protein